MPRGDPWVAIYQDRPSRSAATALPKATTSRISRGPLALGNPGAE